MFPGNPFLTASSYSYCSEYSEAIYAFITSLIWLIASYFFSSSSSAVSPEVPVPSKLATMPASCPGASVVSTGMLDCPVAISC